MGFSMYRTAVSVLLLNHSAGAGSGHTMHHSLPPRGTMIAFKANHQAIQTKMMAMFRLPTGLPQKALKMNR